MTTKYPRLSKAAAGNLAPIPRYSIRGIADETKDPGQGYIVITVPRSLAAPHAVQVNNALRYPVRNNRDKRWLSEPEISEAYRQRFRAADEQVNLADRAMAEGYSQVVGTSPWAAWLLLALVPELHGNMPIDRAAQHALQHELARTKTGILNDGSTLWNRVRIGQRRFQASDVFNSTLPLSQYAKLHSNGTGFFAWPVTSERDATNREGVAVDLPVWDLHLTNGVISGLHFLASHARDRAMAGGDALVMARLALTKEGYLAREWNEMLDRNMGSRTISAMDPVDRVFPLDSIAQPGRELVSASHLLLSDIVQEFGWAEPYKIIRDGEIALSYWSRHLQPGIRAWADEHDIPTFISDHTNR